MDFRAIQFNSLDGLPIYAHLVQPRGWGPYPGVLFVPDWGVHTAEGEHTAEVEALARECLARRYVLMALERRGSPGHGEAYERRRDLGGLEVEDVLAAAARLRHELYVNSSQLLLIASGWGAVSAALAAARSDFFRAAIWAGGVFELTFQYGYEWASRRTALRTATGLTEEQFDHFFQHFPEQERSPVYHADEILCPVLLLHGDQDEEAPSTHSGRMWQALQKAAVPVEFHLLEGIGHAVLENRRVWHLIDEFLKKHVPLFQ